MFCAAASKLWRNGVLGLIQLEWNTTSPRQWEPIGDQSPISWSGRDTASAVPIVTVT